MGALWLVNLARVRQTRTVDPTDAAFSDDQRKHLEMIQAVISRLAGNSFSIRGWTVTVVSVIFAFAAKDANRFFAFIAYVPCVAFWCLDTCYLHRERHFRSLCAAAAQSPVAARLADRFGEEKILYDKYHNAEFSRSDLAFYLPDRTSTKKKQTSWSPSSARTTRRKNGEYRYPHRDGLSRAAETITRDSPTIKVNRGTLIQERRPGEVGYRGEERPGGNLSTRAHPLARHHRAARLDEVLPAAR